MPELRSGARQPRSPPLVPAVAGPAACVETKPTTRRTTPRRRVTAAVTGVPVPDEVAPAPARGNRVRTRAAVAKEAAVVTTRVAGRGKGASARGKAATRNTKPIVQQQQQPKTGATAAAAVVVAAPVVAPKAGAAKGVRGKQVPSRSHSSDPEPLQDPCTSEDNVEEDLDLGEEKQPLEEEIREMEEESAGRSAEKLPGVGDDDGSAAPLPERVIHAFLLACHFP